MTEETEIPKPADVAGRLDGLVMRTGAQENHKTKYCNECGLWEGEWMVCDEPDCGELV